MWKTPIAVVFDLDGTLVDTAPDLLGALNAVLTAEGRKPVVPQDLRHLVGHGARTMFEQAFRDSGTPVPEKQMEALTDRFLDYYRANIACESKPFPGVPETLVELADKGALLGVCTNKPQDLTELLLAALKLEHYFPAVYGAGRTPFSKPDPRHVLEVVKALKMSSDRAVLIGDSPVDVATARAAKIPVIAMSYGYTPIPPAKLGADAVADNFADLPGLIRRLFP